jgi:hypothetical protein
MNDIGAKGGRSSAWLIKRRFRCGSWCANPWLPWEQAAEFSNMTADHPISAFIQNADDGTAPVQGTLAYAQKHVPPPPTPPPLNPRWLDLLCCCSCDCISKSHCLFDRKANFFIVSYIEVQNVSCDSLALLGTGWGLALKCAHRTFLPFLVQRDAVNL